MNNRHPHYDTIVAWAEGKTIQTWHSEDCAWRDWSTGDTAPAFYREKKYRVKPETIRYRTFLRKGYFDNGLRHVDLVTEEANKEKPREEWPQFVRWLGDWQEVEI